MYGTQALNSTSSSMSLFENDVKMYGTQAQTVLGIPLLVFENDVKMYGTQAVQRPQTVVYRLRMM